MPFAFVLPTTAAFAFSPHFSSDSHPSLPLAASTQRGVCRDALKRHKKLPPQEQQSSLVAVESTLSNYTPYLLALDIGLGHQEVAGEAIDVVLRSNPSFEWQSTLSETLLPGRDNGRCKLNSLEWEIFFVLSSLACTQTLRARSALHVLYNSATASPQPEQRTAAIHTATKYLLEAASIHAYLSDRSDALQDQPPCVDITKSTCSALASLAMAEVTLLAVLKDDPYPAAVVQSRNKNDREWMIKAPEIPKVRAHLFARLCVAASEHAANASALLGTEHHKGAGRIDRELVNYVKDLRATGRAKACRFLGIDAELAGQTGQAIAWCQAGQVELGMEVKDDTTKKGLSLGRIKKEWSERREDRRVEKGSDWGSDGGKAEEGRVLEMLTTKWNRMNDTVSESCSQLIPSNHIQINTQVIPPHQPLLALMPSGREMHTIKAYHPPHLDAQTLERMRAPPESKEAMDDGNSSEDEVGDPVGAFPGTESEYYSNQGSRHCY